MTSYKEKIDCTIDGNTIDYELIDVSFHYMMLLIVFTIDSVV